MKLDSKQGESWLIFHTGLTGVLPSSSFPTRLNTCAFLYLPSDIDTNFYHMCTHLSLETLPYNVSAHMLL